MSLITMKPRVAGDGGCACPEGWVTLLDMDGRMTGERARIPGHDCEYVRRRNVLAERAAQEAMRRCGSQRVATYGVTYWLTMDRLVREARERGEL